MYPSVGAWILVNSRFSSDCRTVATREPELRVRLAQGAQPGLGFGQRRLGLEQVRLGLANRRLRHLLLLQGDLVHRLGALQGLLRGGLLGQQVLLPLVLGLVLVDDRHDLRRCALGLVDRGARHLDARPGRFDLLHGRLDASAGLVELRARLVEARLVRAGVDLEEQLAGAHELVVADRQRDDRPRHARRDLDHVGLHLAVPRPGVLEVHTPPADADCNRRKDDRASHPVPDRSVSCRGGS